MLADVVSKNGNLLLSVPLRGDGCIDSEARNTVEGIASWMGVNSEAIIGTRPWKVFGEGAAMEGVAPLSGPGFNEDKNKPLTAADIRFTTKNGVIYAILMGWSETGNVLINNLRADSHKVKKVTLLGRSNELKFEQTIAGLAVTLPEIAEKDEPAYVLKIT
jgi:alpha-L-fucosidase